MVAIENETTTQLTVWIKALLGIKRNWFAYKDVADKQIISALLKETGLTHGATGFVYKVLQGAANNARRAGLLLNPNPVTKQTYSTAVGNTDRMMPSSGRLGPDPRHSQPTHLQRERNAAEHSLQQEGFS